MPRVGLPRIPRLQENRFAALLLALLLLLLVYPLLGRNPTGRLMLGVLSTLVLVAGLYSVSRSARAFLLGLCLAIPAMLDGWDWEGEWAFVEKIGHGADAAFFIFLTAHVVLDVFRARRVTRDTLFGAACVYILFALLFQALFMIVHLHLGLEGITAFSNVTAGADAWDELLHFSFTALTTVGYGHVAPLAPAARSLADLESVIGVLFTAILVARLVSLYTVNERSDAERGEKP